MSAIRRVAIVSCSVAASCLLCELGLAQTRVIRSGSRVVRVAPSPSVRGRTVAPSSSATNRVVPRSTPSRAVSSRSVASSSASSANRVLAKKAPTDAISSRERIENADNDIPESALLTERGLDLVTQLKRLRYAESSLGSRHPSLPGVREQIQSIRRILKSWGNEGNTVASRNDSEKEVVIVSESILDALSKDDLKQLVVRLATDVSDLRKRLSELEEDQLPEDEI